MPSKLQTYMQMADEAQRQITGSYRGWTGFLTTAARLYKYPYAEQVMIHAQRPDATACAEYDFWNEKMGRYVRRGSKGIALIDSSGERPRLRYVFDVSDTGGREFPKSRYSNMVKKVIVPYFRERQITLQELSAKHIQDFYLKELERVSASSVIHYHANIHKALKYAVKLDLISSNPADKIERPKKERFMASFYDADEVNRLFEISKGTKLEIPILFGAFYGMRRSETLGMKWDAIDFERDTITIRHTLTTVALDGKRITVAEDRTKNKSSMRTLPLVPFVKERLLELKAEQEENRRLCGRSYVKDYTGYVCINEIGDIIKPNYVSCGFPKLLEEHGLRRVRYHDLRHSCASLLLANGVPMKQIQEWLGHSDFSTTANIYAHLEYSSKVISADAMLAGLGIGNRE